MPIALPQKFQPLAPWFERHRRDCWRPIVRDGDGGAAVAESKFAGAPWLIPFMFGDGGQGHIVRCPEHGDVLAYPWTCG